MNDYLQMFCWGNYHLIDQDYIQKYLNTRRPNLIEYISQEEWIFQSFIADALIEYVDKNDAQLKILVNSYDMWGNKTIRPDLKNVVYEDCPTFIMGYVLEGAMNPNTDQYNHQIGNPRVLDFIPLTDFRFKVVSMTNKALWWRSKMIDHYEEFGIINPNNCVIWNNTDTGDRYNYKFFKPRIIDRGERFKDEHGSFNSFQLPRDYSKSWFSAVYETSIDIIAMSEKVFTPLLYMKPFIVLGSKGYHQFLKSLGFELYDELIDYSFDMEDNADLRIEKYCKEIAKIDNLTFEQIRYYNDTIKEKLIRNKQKVFELYFDRSHSPKEVTHWRNIIPSGAEILDIDKNVQENFYRAMLKRGWYTKALLPY